MQGLYGIELRNVNISIGIEHEILKADIYLEGKKIGAAINDGWCDETYYEFRNNRNECQFKKILKDNNISKDEFIDRLLFLNGMYRWIKDPTLKNCYQMSFARGNKYV